jgi:hypothetical protein
MKPEKKTDKPIIYLLKECQWLLWPAMIGSPSVVGIYTGHMKTLKDFGLAVACGLTMVLAGIIARRKSSKS